MLPSNTATPLALFGESLRTELNCSPIPTNTAIVLKSSLIWSMTYFPPNIATQGLVILQHIFDVIVMLDGISSCSVYPSLELKVISDGTRGGTHGQAEGKHDTPPLT